MLKQYKMSTETTREPKEQARKLFHGEHILDRMKAGSFEQALSHFWEDLGGKPQDATFWAWLVLLFFSEAVLSEGWFSRAPVSSRSDML